MADRVIKALPNDRWVVQGVSNDGGSRFSAVQANAEQFTYKLDFARWLGSATIASETVTASGATVAYSAASTYLTLTISAVSGSGSVTVKAIGTDGRVKELVLGLLQGRSSSPPAFVTSPVSEAQSIGYSATDSGLSASNVQEAIDELKARTPAITVSTASPSGGVDDDLWFQVAS